MVKYTIVSESRRLFAENKRSFSCIRSSQISRKIETIWLLENEVHNRLGVNYTILRAILRIVYFQRKSYSFKIRGSYTSADRILSVERSSAMIVYFSCDFVFNRTFLYCLGAELGLELLVMWFTRYYTGFLAGCIWAV